MADEVSNLNLMAPATGYDARYADDGGGVIHTRVDQAINWLLNWGRARARGRATCSSSPGRSPTRWRCA